MDNKTIVGAVAKKMGRESRDITALIEGLAQVLKERCGELDSVAIPGFGTFEPVKDDEKIVTDLVTHKRIMMPPVINLNFKPSSLLRKRINKTDL